MDDVRTMKRSITAKAAHDQCHKECGMNRLDDLRKVFEQMGANEEDVAATLRATGVQGVRNTVRLLNPIVRYVQSTLRLDTFNAEVTTGKTLCIYGVRGQGVVLPQPVIDFLDAFNRGAHPDLELPCNLSGSRRKL
jgi:hypothetical protein